VNAKFGFPEQKSGGIRFFRRKQYKPGWKNEKCLNPETLILSVMILYEIMLFY